uniref:Transmembrane protein 132C n=1 Tax=Cacopsylla melanoneura TaxID=428564 RepID=A0A8D8RU56_9HEMI
MTFKLTLMILSIGKPVSSGLWISLIISSLFLFSTRSDLFTSAESIDIHFDNKDSGFFLKQTPYPSSSATDNDSKHRSSGSQGTSNGGFFTTNIADVSKGQNGGAGGVFASKKTVYKNGAAGSGIFDDKIIGVDRFTVFDNSGESTIAIKVNYGPFSTKQTIPSPFIVPEVPFGYFNGGNGTEDGAGASPAAPGGAGAVRASLMSRLAGSNSLDLSVHLVQSQIPRDNPVLRVLFHIGSSNTRRYAKQKLCIILQVSLGSKLLTTSCSPDNEDGVCLAQITIPSFWWTPLPNLPWKKHVKYPTRSVKVSYSVLETKLTPETHRPQVPLRGNTVSEPTSHVRTDRNAERSKLDRQTRGSNVEFPRRRGRREKTPGDADERGSKVEGSDVFGGGFDEDRMLDDDEYVNDETGTDTGNIDGLKRSQRNERDEDKEDEEDEDNYDDEENDDGSESDNKREDTQSTSTAFETRTQRTHRNTDDMQTPSSITNGNEGDMKIVKRTEGIMKTVGKTGNKIEDSTTSRSESSTKQSNSQSSSTRSSNIPRNDDAQIERITDRIIRTNRKQAPSDIGDNESKVDNKEMTGAGEHPQRQQKDQKEYAASAVVASRDTNNIGGESSFQNPPPGDSGNSLQSPPLGAQFEESQCLGHLSERVQIRPITMLGSVPLVHARVSYKEYYLDRNLIVLISHQPLYPLSRIHIPVFIYKQNVNAFVLRCRVKSALRIISVENANTRHWNLSVDISAKSSSATVTARKIGTAGEAIFDGDEGRDPSLGEVLSFLIEVVEESSTELWDEGKLVWTVKYPSDNSKIPNSSAMISQRALVSQYANVFNAYGDGSATVNRKARDSNAGGNTRINGGIARAGDPLGNNNNNNHGVVGGGGEESKTRKVTAKFQIHKDDIYAVLPISKSWQILNTAVLSGRQISQPMKVFIVSQAGKIADVTLQSSCTSEDESVLKVSSSCSSVYVDGTEMRGSSNASILVRYDSYSGLAQFTIWMPEFPLDIQVGDTRLSQIKGWKISASDEIHYSNKFSKRSVVSTGNTGGGSGSNGGRESEIEAGPERVPSGGDNIAPVVNLDDMITEDNDLNSGSGSGQQSSQCRYKYQQTQVQVYARFVAPDHDTGRTRYLVSRRTSLRITDLVSGSMRPADPRIAYLHDNIVFGRSAGRTELQVLSPITGRVIGAREMRVTNDKVTPTSLSVNIVSGLQLNIEPDSSGVENGYVATTSVTRRLTAQYQEGLLDIELAFSDNTRTSIRDIPASDYLLVVDSLNPQVVAFAPMRVGSKHPRVIAVAEGRGELLRVAFLQPDACRPGGALKKSTPLLMSSVKVDIDFDTMGGTSDGLGGPSGTGSGSQKSDFVQNDGSAGNRGAAGNAAVKDFLAPDLRDILIGVPLKDTDSNDQPSVTAQRHSLHHTLSINNLLGPHHPHHNANLAPLEIGMYVLLTSFCIAIIIFVLSCVMYASKFKPPPDQNMDPSLPSSNGGGGFFSAFTTTTSRSAPFNKPSNANNPAGGYHHAYNKVSTSEDNSHDWVWLGRTPLERTAGANQSPMSINKGNNINRMRLMYNPACEENTEEILNNNNSENESSDASSSQRGVIDTNTYVKRDRGSNGIPPPPPPLSKELSKFCEIIHNIIIVYSSIVCNK